MRFNESKRAFTTCQQQESEFENTAWLRLKCQGCILFATRSAAFLGRGNSASCRLMPTRSDGRHRALFTPVFQPSRYNASMLVVIGIVVKSAHKSCQNKKNPNALGGEQRGILIRASIRAWAFESAPSADATELHSFRNVTGIQKVM